MTTTPRTITAHVRYGQSYAWALNLRFRSRRHLIDHLREPWRRPALHDPDNPGTGSDAPHHRSYYPCAGDWEPGTPVAEVITDRGELAARVKVGPRGGLRYEEA